MTIRPGWRQGLASLSVVLAALVIGAITIVADAAEPTDAYQVGRGD